MAEAKSPYAEKLAAYELDDMLAEYTLAGGSQTVGLTLVPKAMAGQVIARREYLDSPEIMLMPGAGPNSLRAWNVDPLVQIRLQGDPTDGYLQGLTMRNSATLADLRFRDQKVIEAEGTITVRTRLKSERGFACDHDLVWRKGDKAVTLQTVFYNRGKEPLTLEMIASFSLGGISPFARDDAPGRLYLHRMRSYWAAEGRAVAESIEDLGLERSWSGHAVHCERFGQVGSMPVRGYFPFIAAEDRKAGVFWGAQLAWAGSWQMEAYRKDDCLCLSGGLADREFGHWARTVAPGKSFTSPPAYVSVVQGDLDDLCARLTRMQAAALEAPGALPESEKDLPVICNEWCTTWGEPQHEKMVAIAERLQGSGVKYLVIDAGWYKGESGVWSLAQGDWKPSPRLFPDGLAATTAAIRERGLIPGIWFEFEVVGAQSPRFSKTRHFLKRDGLPITASGRRFWDFRDPWVDGYLSEKVIGLLRECGMGYLKVDYNETIGIGVDGDESLGEGLRKHIKGVQRFFRKIHAELPELVIENCSSGGHRLEPSMMALVSQASFSDAHETQDIPIIGANLHRLILPRQSQIWAVLHAADSPQRLAYSLAAGFLGRLCLSGEIDRLDPDQWALVNEAIRFYAQAAPIIKHGTSRLYRKIAPAWRHPRGAQALLRLADDGKQALVVLHSFDTPLPGEIRVPLPAGEGWQVAGVFPASSSAPGLEGGGLRFMPAAAFTGQVVLLSH